jgi:aerobic carbon-monoxide dehydrogenase medium subunit
MIPVGFDYLRPATVEDAVAALAEAGDEAKVLAGGQSLMPVLRLRLNAPSLVIDLGGLAQLRGVRTEGDTLVIGAMTTHAEVAADPTVAAHASVIARAAATVGDRQVRHRGTIGGSLAHADPVGDLPAAVLAAGATLVAVGPNGSRQIAAGDFFTDLFTTALAPDEVLTEIRVPSMMGWSAHYEKFHRTAQAWAVVSVAAAVRRENGSIAEARIAVTGLGGTPVRASAVESALAGAAAERGAVEAAAAHAADGTSPPSDLSGSADYRSHLATVLTGRAVAAAAGL